MRINIDRLCELAGVPGAKRTRNSLISEGKDVDHDKQEVDSVDEHGGIFEKKDEEDSELKEDPMEEIIEIDEADLVKELRRARVIMRENKKRKMQAKQKLEEAQLKGIIDQEVKNVIKELQLTSGWVYGRNKPKKSRHGYTHQGSYLKGIGFK